MSKGIITIDIPETCNNCKFTIKENDDDVFCPHTEIYINHYSLNNRYHECPIVKMPEKITDVTYADDNTSELDYAAGWNACIDAMMGGIGENE